MTDSLAPPRFGKRTRGKVSQWDLLTEPGRAVARNNTGNAERLTYKPTLDSDQTVTVPMPTNAPWAFEIMYKTSHAFGERNVFRLYAVGNPNDALYLSWVNNDLRLTDGATTSIVGTTSEYPPGFYYHILVHYKPATGLVDLYFDDVLVLGDRPLNGNADIDRFELRVNGDPGEPIDYFDEVRLGQAAQGTLTVVDDTAIVYEPPPGFFRTTAVDGRARGPFCMMGVCFDCLVEIDGLANCQACMTEVQAGMRIKRQQGANDIRHGAAP